MRNMRNYEEKKRKEKKKRIVKIADVVASGPPNAGMTATLLFMPILCFFISLFQIEI